jgi:hypothetical protein
MAEPAPKRQRSQAQIDAFSKARAAREANLRKKFLAEQETERAQSKKDEPVEQEQMDDLPEPEDEQQPPAQEQPKPKADVEPMQIESSDDQYVDFDPEGFKNELYERLEQQNAELKELR